MTPDFKPTDLIPDINATIITYVIFCKPKHATYGWEAADHRRISSTMPQFFGYITTMLRQMDKEEYDYRIIRIVEKATSEWVDPYWFQKSFEIEQSQLYKK